MISRHIQHAIHDKLKRFPVVGIIGPRQVGKSTLVKSILKTGLKKDALYLDLEMPSDQNVLRDPELFFRENLNRTLALDEIQLRPGLFPVMRSVIDLKRKPARFIVTGSASPALLHQGSETLAGRIIFCELHPFSITEVGADYRKLWLRGGFPSSYLAKSNAVSFEWLTSFINTYIQRDLPVLGLPANRTLMVRLLQMIANAHGSVVNYSALSKSLGISVTTVQKYVEILEDTFVVRRLPAYHVNLKKRIVKAPKAYIRDTGLLHSLWNVNNNSSLLGHHLVGHSWEGFVIQQIAAHLKDTVQLYYYRTQDGAEADLIIAQADKPFVCIEIKLTDNPVLTKGNHIALQDLGARHNFIVTPSAREHSIHKNIRVVDLVTLLQKLRDLKVSY